MTGHPYITILVIILLILIVIFTNVKEMKSKKDEVCLIHKWEYVEQPGMPDVYYIKCAVCQKLPEYE